MKIILLYFLSIIYQNIKTVHFTESMYNLKILEEYIQEYKSQNNINNSLTHLITCYIREGAYTGTSWTIAGGSIPSGLSTFIEEKDSNSSTNVHLVKTYREIELPNNEKFDFVHLFAVMNGIEYGGSYSSKFAHLVGWGGDTFQLFKDIKNEQGNLDNLIQTAKNYLGIKGGFGAADLISDLDAPILLQKKNEDNYFADIIQNYYSGEEYLNRVNKFLKITFPKIQYLDKFRKNILTIYSGDTYIRVLECKEGLRKGLGSCALTFDVYSEYENKQKAAVYAFADYLSERCTGYEKSLAFILNIKIIVLLLTLLLLF